MIEPLAQQGQVSPRVLPGQASLESSEAFLPGAEPTVDAAQQPLFQIVDTLGLLLQAFARVAQAPRQAFQM